MKTKEKIEVMQAYEDGKEIEINVNITDRDEKELTSWGLNTVEPSWNWEHGEYRIKPETAPASLMDRIKAEYGDYEVVMLEWDDTQILSVPILVDAHSMTLKPHTIAQSMKGFYQYVYESTSVEGKFYSYDRPVNHGRTPVAVLFTK